MPRRTFLGPLLIWVSLSADQRSEVRSEVTGGHGHACHILHVTSALCDIMAESRQPDRSRFVAIATRSWLLYGVARPLHKSGAARRATYSRSAANNSAFPSRPASRPAPGWASSARGPPPRGCRRRSRACSNSTASSTPSTRWRQTRAVSSRPSHSWLPKANGWPNRHCQRPPRVAATFVSDGWRNMLCTVVALQWENQSEIRFIETGFF